MINLAQSAVHSRRSVGLALLAVLLLGAAAQAQELQLSEAHFARVDEVLRQFTDEGMVAGAQALLWQGGEVVYCRWEGVQDLESGMPMTDSTLFRIYSMTKPVTSVAALMLYEQGKLELMDPVSRYIPAFAGPEIYDGDAPGQRVASPSEITVHDLLTHRAGLTYGLFSNTPVDSMYWAHRIWPSPSLEEFVARVATVPLLHEPGTQWHYSVATDVLGRVVEVVSGQPLDEFFRQHILDPLEMHDTAFSVPAASMHRFSTLYSPASDGGLRVTDRGESSDFADPVEFLSGGGGLVSTPTDYIRFAEMLIRKGSLGDVQILKPETVELMAQNHLHYDPDAGWGFGLGVEVFIDPQSIGEPGHAGMYGWSGAANTFFFVDPEAALIGMIFMQRRPFDRERFLLPFKRAVYDPVH